MTIRPSASASPARCTAMRRSVGSNANAVASIDTAPSVATGLDGRSRPSAGSGARRRKRTRAPSLKPATTYSLPVAAPITGAHMMPRGLAGFPGGRRSSGRRHTSLCCWPSASNAQAVFAAVVKMASVRRRCSGPAMSRTTRGWLKTGPSSLYVN
ncbi:MAG: hypothetical protein U1F52_19710 [Burkholderiales bacterium]